MGRCPDESLTLERIKNDRGYGPGNVRWASRIEQARNRSDTRLLTCKGRTMCMVAWAEELGCSRNVLWERLKMDWSEEETLTRPVRKLRWKLVNG